MRAHVFVRHKDATAREFPLLQDVVVVGRGAHSQESGSRMCLADKTRKVSRTHAAIVLSDSKSHFVRDLGSANGTFVNGQRCYRRTLRSGDKISIGSYTLEYEEQEGRPSDCPLFNLVKRELPTDINFYKKGTLLDSSTSDTQPESFPRWRERATGLLEELAMIPNETGVAAELLKSLARDMGVTQGCVVSLGPTGSTTLIAWTGGSTFSVFEDWWNLMVQQGGTCYDEGGILSPIVVSDEPVGAVSLSANHDRPFNGEDVDYVNFMVQALASKLLPSAAKKVEGVEVHSKRDAVRWSSSLVGVSSAISSIREKLELLAKENNNVLLIGEPGTGKGVAAQYLHSRSDRRDGPFIKVDLASLPEDTIESELFGSVPGAFTGAVNRPGYFEQSSGGTLFLDEIGDISIEIQNKLRRAIENKVIARVGSTKPINVDTRLVCATNVPVQEAADDGKFKKDLLQRLGAVIRLPDLRRRVEDIPLLAHYLIDEIDRKLIAISHSAMNTLTTYSWPGNVRELRQLIESMASEDREFVFSWDLLDRLKLPTGQKEQQVTESLEDTERQRIIEVLKQTGGNKTKAAELLGIVRMTLYSKLEKYGLQDKGPT
jgi:DNA-binding NtrC family response regulator